MNGTEDWPLAEIISIREAQGHLYFYVHYVDCKFGCTAAAIQQIYTLFIPFLNLFPPFRSQ